MPWNLLILPLVAGYFLLTKCYIFKFHQQRLDRQRLIFESILLGIAIMIVSYLLRLVSIYFIPEIINSIHSYSPFQIPYALTSLFSLGVSIVFTFIYNKLSTKEKWVKKSIKDVGNEFELLMNYSFTKGVLLQFTLDNKKVYVAWVKELPIPSISSYVRVIPAISGYRTDEHDVVFTTHYLSVYADYIKNGEVRNITELNTDIIIDINNIIIVSNFDREMYKRFKNQSSENITLD